MTRLLSGIWRAAWQQLSAAGIDAAEARLEAEVLLRHVLGMDRAAFLARRDEDLPQDAALRFAALLQRRLAREPLAYIVGHREFYGLDFVVDARVLIPRPETEGLVERAIAVARRDQRSESRGQEVTIVDVGTGSGCIAIALAAHLPDAHIVAIDESADALLVAQENARRLGLSDRIDFRQGDLLAGLNHEIDIIVSNPPYIPSRELPALQPEITEYEPVAALDGGPDGLSVIGRLLAQAPACLKPAGVLLLEIGQGQGSAVKALAEVSFPHAAVVVERDLAGLERYVTIHGLDKGAQ